LFNKYLFRFKLNALYINPKDRITANTSGKKGPDIKDGGINRIKIRKNLSILVNGLKEFNNFDIFEIFAQIN
jgi:hypothetical protein